MAERCIFCPVCESDDVIKVNPDEYMCMDCGEWFVKEDQNEG